MKRFTRLSIIAAALLAPTHDLHADAITSFRESCGGTIRTGPGSNGKPVMTCELNDGTSMNAVAFFRNQHRTLK